MPPRKRDPIRLDQIDLPDEITADAGKGKKKTPPKPITKTALKKMFETCNAAFALSGHLDMALQDIELDTLAEAWHDVIVMYPQVGGMLTHTNKLTVWGNALFVTFVIVERRRALFVTNTAGPARNASGDDGQRKDNASAPPAGVTPIRASS